MAAKPYPDSTPKEPHNLTDEEIKEKFPSLNLLHDQAQWAFERELEHSNAIDSKSGAVLASASFLLAGMATLQVAVGNPAIRLSNYTKTSAQHLAYAIAFIFVLVILSSLTAMWPRSFKIAPDPYTLSKKYAGKSEGQIKDALLSSRVPNYQDMKGKITWKSRFMRLSFVLVAIEAVLLAIVLWIAASAL